MEEMDSTWSRKSSLIRKLPNPSKMWQMLFHGLKWPLKGAEVSSYPNSAVFPNWNFWTESLKGLVYIILEVVWDLITVTIAYIYTLSCHYYYSCARVLWYITHSNGWEIAQKCTKYFWVEKNPMPIGHWVIGLRMPFSICQWADWLICLWMTNWAGDSNGKIYEWMGNQWYFNHFLPVYLSVCQFTIYVVWFTYNQVQED